MGTIPDTGRIWLPVASTADASPDRVLPLPPERGRQLIVRCAVKPVDGLPSPAVPPSGPVLHYPKHGT